MEGLAGMPIVTVPHPIDRLTQAQAERAGVNAYEEIVSVLTGDARQLESLYVNKQWLAEADAVTCSLGWYAEEESARASSGDTRVGSASSVS